MTERKQFKLLSGPECCCLFQELSPPWSVQSQMSLLVDLWATLPRVVNSRRSWQNVVLGQLDGFQWKLETVCKGEAGWRWTKDLWDKTIGQKSWKKSWVPSRSVPNSIACRWYGISWRRKKTGFSPDTLSYKQTIRTTSPQNFHEICQQTYIFCTQSQVLESFQRRKHI